MRRLVRPEQNPAQVEAEKRRLKLVEETRALIEDRPEGKGRYFGWLKKILFFNPLFERDDYWFGFGHQQFFDVLCPVANCYLTNNRTLLGNKQFR